MGEVRFMISEAAKQVHVESHVLRYWEEELELVIGRTEMGHRYYTEDDIQLFCCIKKLKDAGMLLKDLKPLIPELKATKQKLQNLEAPSDAVSELPALPSHRHTKPDMPVSGQIRQVRSLIGDVLTEVIQANNETLKNDIAGAVTSDIMKEMDFLFQAKERREEEHFRKLDTLIRQQQANRREAAHETPIGKFRKMFT